MTNHWRRQVICCVMVWIACVLLVSVDALTSHRTVEADIDEKNHIGLIGTKKRSDGSWGPRGPQWITRNLVDGQAISVCSKDYPQATRIAVDRWNEALRIKAFAMLEDAEACSKGPPDRGWMSKDGVFGVTVSRGQWQNSEGDWVSTVPTGKWTDQQYREPISGITCDSWGGCARFDVMHKSADGYDTANSDWQSYHGRGMVAMNPWSYPHDIDERSYTNIRRDIAHELGHILALVDYFCHFPGAKPDVSDHPYKIEPPTRALMNSFTGRTRTVTVRGISEELSCNALGDVPSNYDKSHYRAAYFPATVTEVRGTTNGRAVALTWDQSDVFVESHFEIQRASGPSGTNWTTVERSVPANATRFTLTDQPSGVQLYRVVAATLALCPKPAPEHCIDDSKREPVYGNPSNTASVAIQLPAPTGLQVTNQTPNSLSLTWNTVSGADRYELRQTTPNTNCEGAVQATVTKPPHPFRNLTADTDYRLCVRAKLSTNSAVTSAWADEEATTSPVPRLTVSVSPRSASCYTGGSVSISWTISNGTTPYAVRVNGVSASGSRKMVTCRSTAGTQTVSVTATDASTPQRSGSASVSLTVTNPPPPPPPPRVRPSQPAPAVTTEEVGRTTVGWDWRPFGDLPGGGQPDPPGSCYFELYQRDRYSLAEFTTWWKFNTSRWKWELDESTKRQTGLQSAYIYTGWYSTGLREPCRTPEDGVAGASASAAPTAGTLLPGDYVMAWGGGWFSFTIPSDAEVQWGSRTVGEREAMVFSVAGGEEVVIIPSQIAASPPTSDNATLSAIVASFRAETDPAKLPASAQQQTCAEAPARDDAGALSLDLDAQWCSVVSSGGELSVRYGADQISLTVSAGRVWLIFAAAQSESTAAAGIWVMERQSKAYVVLNPSDGSELERHVPADAAGLPALLDAIAASAAPSVYPAADR